MRHRVGKKKMNRDTSHRSALLKNLSTSLIEAESIETTIAKAKFVKPYVEKLVTKAKSDTSFTSIKRVSAKLNSKDATRKLFTQIAPKYVDRNGGYTRIIKLGKFRDGDNSKMVRLSFVEDTKKITKKENE